jgi:hypothetical protein
VSRRDRRAAALVLTSVVAAVLYSNFVLDWVLRGFDGMGNVVSHLAAPGQPNAGIVRVTDVVCAVLVLALLPAVRRALPLRPWRAVVVGGTVVFAAGAVIAAAIPTPCGPHSACDAPAQLLQGFLHNSASVVSDVGLYVGTAAAWFTTRRTGPRWFHRAAVWLFWVTGVVASALFVLLAEVGPDWATAFSQRVHIVGISVWIVCLGLLAAAAVPDRSGRDDRGTTSAPPPRDEDHEREGPR